MMQSMQNYQNLNANMGMEDPLSSLIAEPLEILTLSTELQNVASIPDETAAFYSLYGIGFGHQQQNQQQHCQPHQNLLTFCGSESSWSPTISTSSENSSSGITDMTIARPKPIGARDTNTMIHTKQTPSNPPSFTWHNNLRGFTRDKEVVRLQKEVSELREEITFLKMQVQTQREYVRHFMYTAEERGKRTAYYEEPQGFGSSIQYSPGFHGSSFYQQQSPSDYLGIRSPSPSFEMLPTNGQFGGL